MRLWSIAPKYLDSKGLVALWREGLLAISVLSGQTKGYVHHPQLDRFRAHPDPLSAINFYLEIAAAEAVKRGYHFDSTKIIPGCKPALIPINEDQLRYELAHLRVKLQLRDPKWLLTLNTIEIPEPHPLFYVIPGPVENWERGSLTELHTAH